MGPARRVKDCVSASVVLEGYQVLASEGVERSGILLRLKLVQFPENGTPRRHSGLGPLMIVYDAESETVEVGCGTRRYSFTEAVISAYWPNAFIASATLGCSIALRSIWSRSAERPALAGFNSFLHTARPLAVIRLSPPPGAAPPVTAKHETRISLRESNVPRWVAWFS